MLRSFAYILLILYTAIQAIGLSVNLHFCGDRLSEVGINTAESCCMCDDSKTEAMGCCEDQHLYIKVSTEHATSAAYQMPEHDTFVWITPHIGNLLGIQNLGLSCANNTAYYTDSSPPLQQLQYSWLHFQSLRL